MFSLKIQLSIANIKQSQKSILILPYISILTNYPMKKIYLLTLVAIALIYSSCTVEKRHYMSGYHVEWNHKAPKIGGEGNTKNVIEETLQVAENEEKSTIQLDEIRSEEILNSTTPTPTIIDIPSKHKPHTSAQVEKKTVEKNQAIVENAKEKISPRIINTTSETQSISHQANSETDLVLLVILAILLPPLAVYLHEGTWNNVCWLNLVLTLFFWLGAIHALLVIFEVI
jgi:uncharacterized membrane protein YqaE (UPF0057 family)